MKMFNSILALSLMATASVCRAQLTFSGPATLGSITSSATVSPAPIITITSPATGINLTGDFYITTAGNTTGNMITWNVDRPISGTSGPFNMTTIYTGFTSMTGPGTNVLTSGVMESHIYNGGAVVPGTSSSITFSQSGLLTNYSLSNTVAVTGYTFTPGDTLRLQYFVDLNYVGPGAVYDINFPAETVVTALPEPTSAMLVLGGMAMLAARRRR
ncbi:MAG: PEP-CTERM sorting domain-containing protein [Burkholderiales bacterium]|nr:PEP-CTERM sorting domain-containing protein [Phycisphaerae bacterium]